MEVTRGSMYSVFRLICSTVAQAPYVAPGQGGSLAHLVVLHCLEVVEYRLASCRATMLWEGQPREVLADAADTTSLRMHVLNC